MNLCVDIEKPKDKQVKDHDSPVARYRIKVTPPPKSKKPRKKKTKKPKSSPRVLSEEERSREKVRAFLDNGSEWPDCDDQGSMTILQTLQQGSSPSPVTIP